MCDSKERPRSNPKVINQDNAPAARGLVVDIDHFAIHDGPGIRTAVFLKGCPLHCIWCHSPETQSFSPELLYLRPKVQCVWFMLEYMPAGCYFPVENRSSSSPDLPGCQVAIDWKKCTHCGVCTSVCYSGALKISGTWMLAAELVAEVAKNQPFFSASGGGVTLSGGEATAQPAFASQFLAGCHSLGIHTALETNGCAPWQVYQDLLEVVDLFLYDIKHMDDSRHRQYTGASNHLALSNLRRMAERRAEVIVRIPCIPGFNDDPANIQATAAFVHQIGLQTIHLLPYNPSAGAKYLWLGRAYDLEALSPRAAKKWRSWRQSAARMG
jgi:pyruvate formate lyase activating enzyme